MFTRKILLLWLPVLLGMGIYFGHRGYAATSERRQSLKDILQEWVYVPTDRHADTSGQSTDGTLGFHVTRVEEEPGGAQELFDRAARFYSKKCGSSLDPINSRIAQNKRTVFTETGGAHGQGQYFISEPATCIVPQASVPVRPEEFQFDYHHKGLSVVVSLCQLNADQILIRVTAAIQ